MFVVDLPQVYFQRAHGRHTALREIYLQDPSKKSKNPTPGTTKMCEPPGVARGGWSGLELTDT